VCVCCTGDRGSGEHSRDCLITSTPNSVNQALISCYLGKILDTSVVASASKSVPYFVLESGLKIRVSVVRFRPWPPSNQKLRRADQTSTVEYSWTCGMNIPQDGRDGGRNRLVGIGKLTEYSRETRTEAPLAGFRCSVRQGPLWVVSEGAMDSRESTSRSPQTEVSVRSAPYGLRGPGCRSRLRCRRALYAASACCAASSGATFHGSNSSIRLIG